MEGTQLVQELKALLKERFPGNYNYTPLLADILGVHEKTVLSKLRGATQFTVEELYKIGDNLSIDVGEIFRKIDHPKKHPMDIYIHDFSILREEQWLVTQTLKSYRLAASSEHSTYMVASNTLPDLVFAGYEWIAKFTYMKWLYFNKGRQQTISVSDIELKETDREVHREYLKCINSFKRSVYILHIDMMQFIGHDILFFYRIRLINSEEVRLVIEDYNHMLQEFEDICEGKVEFPNKKEILIFFSHVLMSNDITLIESDELNLGILYTYFHNPVVTTRMNTFRIFQQWFDAWMHSANIISVSDPIQRYEFFHKQKGDLKRVEEQLKQI